MIKRIILPLSIVILSILLLSFVSAQTKVIIEPIPSSIEAGSNITITINPGTEGIGPNIIIKNSTMTRPLGTMCDNESKCYNTKEFMFYIPTGWQGTYSVSYTEYIKDEFDNVVGHEGATTDFFVYKPEDLTEAAKHIVGTTTSFVATSLTSTGAKMGTKYKCAFAQKSGCIRIASFEELYKDDDLIKPCEGCSEAINKCGSTCPTGWTWTGNCVTKTTNLGGLLGSSTETKLHLITSGIGEFLGGLLKAVVSVAVVAAVVYFGAIGLAALGVIGTVPALTTLLYIGAGVTATSLLLTHETATHLLIDNIINPVVCGFANIAGKGESCRNKLTGDNFEDLISSKYLTPECENRLYADYGKKCDAGYTVYSTVYWDDINEKEASSANGWTECSYYYAHCEGEVLESASCEICPKQGNDLDGDCILNENDKCSNTPEDERGIVDWNGCSPSQRDSDGDGVNDKLDECPNTPKGQTAKPDGCSEAQRPTPKCSDGTLYSTCSLSKPFYCDNGQLVFNCQECGCNEGQGCDSTTGYCYNLCECDSWKIIGCGKGDVSNCPVGKLLQYRSCNPDRCDIETRCIDFKSCTEWQKVGRIETGWLNALFKSTNNNLYAAARWKIVKSEDNGTTWTEVSHIIGYPDVLSLIETENGIFYAGTDEGQVFKSTDKGVTWSSTGNLNVGKVYSLVRIEYGLGTKIIAATGPNGAIMTSTDNGTTWKNATIPKNAMVNRIIRLRGYNTELFATGSMDQKAVVLHSYGGETWEVEGGAVLGSDSSAFTAIYTKNYDLYAGTGGDSKTHIFEEGHNGWGWYEVNVATPRNYIFELYEGSNGYLYAGASSGTVLRSTNNGDSWEFFGDFTSDTSNVDFLFEIGNYIYAATDPGNIYRRNITA